MTAVSRRRVFVVEIPEAVPRFVDAALCVQWFPFLVAVAQREGLKCSPVVVMGNARVLDSSSDGDAGYLADAVSDYLRSCDAAASRASVLLHSPVKGSA